MLQHIEQKRVPYTQSEMFALVADVERYNEFLPWCVASRVKKREGNSLFYADLVVGYKMFRERFSSKVMLKKDEEITIEYLKGPLKQLQNQWRFLDNGDGSCTIDFVVTFEFGNVFLQKLATTFFNEVVKRMVAAFENRAATLYGPRSL